MLLIYMILMAHGALTSSTALWHYWVLPSLIGQVFLRFYFLHEHRGCPLGSFMFSVTRTTYTSWLICALAWNMPFHAEHHAWPTIPFHLLPSLHETIGRASVLKTACKPNGANGLIAVHAVIVQEIGRPKDK